ncbi:restriction endonuclease subunit S [Helicobacter japonicus]|uniref:restriction endonuclease subunit S n=1 Tax=Helicobacter japonicus TaxID=425400 RepID=UPI0023F45F73|nr:restriction endonuclease subunit S [Helicobacter japonicus]
MSSLLQNLPQGWQVKTLGEVSKVITGKTPPKSRPEYFKGKIPFVKPNDLDKDIFICQSEDTLTELGFKYAPFIPKNSVLVSCIGNLGKKAILEINGSCNQQINAIIPNENLDYKFLYYQINILKNWLEQNASATTIKIINKSKFEKAPIILPPLEVQKAIVEKLESAFAHIDEAVRHLKAVQTNIPRLKSSLLHCAFSGKLTESQITTPTSTLSFSQRKSNPSPLPLTKETLPFFCTKGEPAHSPLLAKNRAGGTTAPAFSDFSHHEVGAEPHYDCHSKALAEESKDNNTHTLPKNWEVKTLGKIVLTTSGGTPSRKNMEYWNGNIKWLKSGELNDDYIKDSEESITQKGLDNSSAKIFQKGTLLIALYGATIGKLGILDIDLSTNQAICGIIPLQENCLEIKYLFYYLFSLRKKMLQDAFGGAQLNISQSYLRGLPIPLPPLATQNQIVQILESKFAHLEKLEQFVNASLENLQRLKSSLLNQAFKGELV